MTHKKYVPTAAQLQQYQTEGYFIFGKLFEPEELGEVTDYILDRVVEKKVVPDLQPHVTDGFLRAWCSQPRLLDLVEPLLGPDLALWTVHCFYKPAKIGSRTPWHQDAQYWQMQPVVTASIWLALEPVDQGNGCMQVMPGTHTENNYSHHEIDKENENAALHLEVDENLIDESKAVPVELNTGECSVHHSHLLHGAVANKSNRSRNGLVMRFMPTSSVRKAGDVYLARGQDRSLGQTVYCGRYDA